MGSTKHALRVVEGKLRGHVYDLPENSELFLGRGANFDIVIDEDMVSRRHAKILTFHDQVVLQDLNSTNGTSVNQQRIQGSQRLQIGDTLTIGTCVLEVISPPQQGGYNLGEASTNAFGAHVPQAPHMQPAPQNNLPNYPNQGYSGMGGHQGTPPIAPPAYGGRFNQVAPPPPPAASGFPPASLGQHSAPVGTPSFNGMSSISGARPRMKSSVGTFPSAESADILTMIERLVERRHDGVLAVFDPEEREGSVYLRGGRVYFSTYEDPHRVMDVVTPPQEALIKICCWTQGRYKVKTMGALPSFEQEISEDSRSLLERVRHSCAEMNQLRAQLPPLSQTLNLCQPLNPPLTSLSQEQLYLLQLTINQYEIRSIIDCHPQGEREGIKTLLFLLEQGYLQS